MFGPKSAILKERNFVGHIKDRLYHDTQKDDVGWQRIKNADKLQDMMSSALEST